MNLQTKATSQLMNFRVSMYIALPVAPNSPPNILAAPAATLAMPYLSTYPRSTRRTCKQAREGISRPSAALPVGATNRTLGAYCRRAGTDEQVCLCGQLTS